MNRTYILISGSSILNKNFHNGKICDLLKLLMDIVGYNLTIIHGNCPKGIDCLVKYYCEQLGIDQIIYPANWKKYDKKAGWIRNNLMFDHGMPDYVICIYNNLLRKSPGTKMSEKLSTKYETPCYVTCVRELMCGFDLLKEGITYWLESSK